MRSASSLAVAILALSGTHCGGTTLPSIPPLPPAPQKVESVNEPAPIVISVVGTNDLHGNVESVAVLGGFMRNLRRARETDGGVFLVDAGDMFQGTIVSNHSEGQVVLRAYNLVGYNGAAIGNHEFDYGPVGPAATPQNPGDNPRGALFALAANARFAFLAANYRDAASGAPVSWPHVATSVVIDVRGIKVGLIGVSTMETLDTTISTNVDDLRMAPLAGVITQQASELRSGQGAKVVVVIAHAGAKCKSFDDPTDVSSCASDAEVLDVARAIPSGLIDVIVGAHTHGGVAHRVNGIAVVEAYAYGRAFSRVDLTVAPSTGAVLDSHIHPPHDLCRGDAKSLDTCDPGEYEAAPVVIDTRVIEAIRPDLEEANKKRSEPLGVTLAEPLTRSDSGSAPLSNWVGDLMLQAHPKADVAIINAGGIRADLPAGTLTYGSFYTMFPFDNRFALATVKAGAIRKLLESSLRKGDAFAISGVRAVATCERGGLRVRLLRNGRPVGDEAPLRLLVSDYLAATSTFADAGMPKSAFTYPDGPGIRDALVALLRDRGGIVPAQDLSRFDPKRPRVAVPNGPPVQCAPTP